MSLSLQKYMPSEDPSAVVGSTLAGERVAKLLWKYTSQLLECRAECQEYLKTVVEAFKEDCVLIHS